MSSMGIPAPPNPARWTFPEESEGWELREETLPDPQDNHVSEEIFSIGNGNIGVRGYPEESSLGVNSPLYSNVESSQGGGATFHTTTSSDKKPHQQHLNSSGVGEMSDFLDSSQGGHPERDIRYSFASNSLSESFSVDESIPRGPIRGFYVSGFTEMHIPASYGHPYSDSHVLNGSYMVRAPDPFCVDVIIGGEHVSPATGRIVSHTRRLNLRTGELYRRMVWESRTSPKEVTIESTRFISAVKNIAATRFAVSARNANHTEIRLISRTTIPNDGKTRAACGVERVSVGATIAAASATLLVRTPRSCRHLAVATTESCRSFARPRKPLRGGSPARGGGTSTTALTDLSHGEGMGKGGFPPPSGGGGGGGSRSRDPRPATTTTPTTLTPTAAELDAGAETIFFSVLPEHVTFELTKYVGLLVEEDAPHEDLCEIVLQRTQAAAREGYEALFQEHTCALARFWKHADVVYRGDVAMQGAFRYHILQVNMSYGAPALFGFPSRSLTGEKMSGGYEWGVDAFIIPFFTHVCPERARALLEFRIQTLYQARTTARGAGLSRGALYSLRSTPRLNPPFHAYFPFLNALIAHAMRQYVVATGDLALLHSRGGAEVVLAAALVWLEWGVWEGGRFHLRGVFGADRYGGLLSDPLFTNLMAREQMRWVGTLAGRLRATAPERWREILADCEASEEDLVAIARAAEGMTIPYDAEHRVHPVDDTFLTKQKWRFSDLRVRPTRGGALIDRFHPYLIYRHQVCHVPDVLLAIMLLPDCFSPEEVRADFELYESITAPDSSLQIFIKGVLAARLRLVEKAMTYFRQALFLDLDNLMGDTGGGLHCSNMAGSWWVLAMGFGGVRVSEETLHFDPRLPEGCAGYEIKIRHAGGLVQAVVKPRIVTYTLLEGPADGSGGLLLIHDGTRRVRLAKDEPQKVRLRHDVCVFDFDCVIFDIDSILLDLQDVHYAAWKEALEEYFTDIAMPDFSMTRELFLAYLSHNRPMNGLAELFKRFNRPLPPSGGQTNSEGAQLLTDLFSRKLHKFRQIIQKQSLQLREGTIQFLTNLRANGIMVGCVTDSRNGRWILNEWPQLQALFDHFIDAVDGESLGWCYRPEMDYFKSCAKSMDCACARTVIVMDSAEGYSKSCVEQFCMLIGVSEKPEAQQFRIPYVKINDFKDLTTELINEYIGDDTLQSHRGNRRLLKVTCNEDLTGP